MPINLNKKQTILSIVKKKIQKIDPDSRIILFGSRARDSFHKDSDWDFLILTKMTVTPDLKSKFFDSLFEAELETDEVLTGIIQNQKVWEDYSETPIYKNILTDGVLI